ncbi:glycoside hydrolase family 13 protein [Kushneria aurantia]|uniref:Glycoside hydrolase family 13 protein n=1 Tax=Kushneria aurantia TaxID=504092 RepID=A0ABV6G739_9GAMM|nr:glycoside hydrolase family 13 protein [Kushneria aurantia]
MSAESNPMFTGHDDNWWRHAVIYQIYPRSFADARGDGIGDLRGVYDRLPWLARLGIDAIWLSPFYRSPQNDAGYDVADYRAVDQLFGTLDDFDAMLERAHATGLKVIIDLVPNHTSAEHVWFQAALYAPRGSPERARYIFRDGRGDNGEEPPNNWHSVFGGGAWTRVEDGQWYLHMFDTSQPDLNWRNEEVRAEFDDILRFWLDRGVDGFRVDIAHGMIKQEGLPDTDHHVGLGEGSHKGPMWDQEEVHDIYRRWRRILDDYEGRRIMVAEAWISPQSRLARYTRPDEMHQAFNFDYLLTPWRAGALRDVIDLSLANLAAVDSTPTWVMSNHDIVRHATRLGQLEGQDPPDEELGLRRARAAIMLTLALPGSVYVYQGEELGLPEYLDMPDQYRQDPAFFRSGGSERGRDGCRVPLPWEAESRGYGFSPTGASWLPQPEVYVHYAADVQERDPESTLWLYRRLLELRRAHGLGSGRVEWLDSGRDDVLMLRNGSVTAVINFGDEPFKLPTDRRLISSLPGRDGHELLGSAAAWLVEVETQDLSMANDPS